MCAASKYFRNLSESISQNATSEMELEQQVAKVEHCNKLLKMIQQNEMMLARGKSLQNFGQYLNELEKTVLIVTKSLYSQYDIANDDLEKKRLQKLLVRLAQASFVVTDEPNVKRKLPKKAAQDSSSFYEHYQMITLGNAINCEVKLLGGYRCVPGKPESKSLTVEVLRDDCIDQEVQTKLNCKNKLDNKISAETVKGNRPNSLPVLAASCKFSCEWRNSEQKHRTSVASTKYSLRFSCSVEICGQQTKLYCHTLPFVIVVNVSQECDARATLFWDNAFSYMCATADCSCVSKAENVHYCRVKFAQPEKVHWTVFIRKLSDWFRALTECELDQVHMEFISQCVQVDQWVTFARFCKETLSKPIEAKFWTWLFNVKKFVCEHAPVRILWRSGTLYGFATQDQARELMKRKLTDLDRSQTFLLRFCNSEEKAALVVMQGFINEGRVSVRSLKPFGNEDCKTDRELVLKLKQYSRAFIYQKCTTEGPQCFGPQHLLQFSMILQELLQCLSMDNMDNNDNHSEYRYVSPDSLSQDDMAASPTPVASPWDQLCMQNVAQSPNVFTSNNANANCPGSYANQWPMQNDLNKEDLHPMQVDLQNVAQQQFPLHWPQTALASVGNNYVMQFDDVPLSFSDGFVAPPPPPQFETLEWQLTPNLGNRDIFASLQDGTSLGLDDIDPSFRPGIAK